MKFSCPKELLSEAVNTAQKAVPSKTALPILECLKLDVTNNGVFTVTGNNMELCIEFRGTCNVYDGGSVALSSKMFGEIVRKLPEGIVNIEVNETNNVTTIVCGNSEFNIQGMFSEEYPASPRIDEVYSFSIKEGVLKNIIKKTIPFTAMTEGSRPAQVGVLFELEGNDITAVSSDGRRVAVVKEKLNDAVNSGKVIIPGNTLRELIKIISDGDDDVKITVDERRVLIDCGDYKMYTRIIDGNFLRYAPIIAAPNSIFAELNRNIITDSLERAQLIINEDTEDKEIKIPVKFNIGLNKIEVSAMTGKGKFYDVVPANVSGGELTIGFNCKFMLDVLRVCDEDEIRMEFTTPTGGCFIKTETETGSELFMILPVQLNR